MKIRKITKGFYQVEIDRGVVFIKHNPEIQGMNKWMVYSEDIDVDYYMDSLWNTKSEAVYMIGEEL